MFDGVRWIPHTVAVVTLPRRSKMNHLLDKLLEEQRRENEAAALVPCSEEQARKQHEFLKSWAKKKPITKYGGEESTFWKCGKFMTKIHPGEIAGMVKYGYAVRDGNTLRLNP
jgi:hypothetical protein